MRITICMLTRVFVSIVDTKEASLLYSYAKEMSSSGALEDDDKPEDMPGMSDEPCCFIYLI